MIGQHISHFYILRQLGSGGMGVVYEAQDTRLPRSVAIKFLKSTLSTDPDALRRFKREAQLASSLNHPNICTILDVDEADGASFIAMELLRGRSLKSRLAGEPLPLSEIIDIATQVADGLAAAHDQGIIHRDIAPGNVFITESGLVKVLDFGLAKHFAASEVDGQTTDELTAPGVAAGTLAYMAPELLTQDAPVDYRCDLFSLGILLDRMASGARPAELERIIDKLLAKRPEDRYQSARALRADLVELRGDSAGTTSRAGAPSARWSNRRRLAFGGVAAAGIALTLLAARGLRSPMPEPTTFVIPGLIDPSPGSSVTITPDGRTLLYTGSVDAGRPIMLRPVRQLGARALAGTEGGNKPFVAPGGRLLAFFGSDDKLKTIPIEGGTATVVAGGWRFGDGGWDGDNTIVTDGFRNVERGLSQRALDGSAPMILTRPDTAAREGTHTAPLVLPSRRAIVFTVVSVDGTGSGPKNGQLAMVTLGQRPEGRSLTPHVRLGVNARRAIAFVDGWLLYITTDGAAIMAVPLDEQRQRVSGTPITVLEDPSANMESASVANNGTLVYVRRSRVNSPVLVDARGGVRPLLRASDGPFMNPRFSPDGKRFSLQITSPDGATHVSLYDTASRTPTRLNASGQAVQPTWTPDGRSIVFWALKAAVTEFWLQPVDGSSPPRRIATASRGFAPAVTPDGQTLLFQQTTDSVPRIWAAPMSGAGAPHRVMDDQAANYTPEISPDGKWLAYVSRHERHEEVFVRAYPGPGAPVQVSVSGGNEPAWSPNGQRIYYRDKRALLSALITSPSLAVASRDTVLHGAYETMPHRNYDVAPDGKHFLMLASPTAEDPATVIVLNWLPAVRDALRAVKR